MGRQIKAKELRTVGTVECARWLLGKSLVRRLTNGSLDSRIITEVEAYDGERDLACHARAGRTARTAPLYQEGGIWYVYLCYGIHEMLNLVVGPRDWPAAILIRGVEGVHGPGRVTKTLEINRTLNRLAAEPASGLWLEDNGVRVPRKCVQATPRIGVDYAGIIWSKKPWRFVLTDVEGCLGAKKPAGPRANKKTPAPRTLDEVRARVLRERGQAALGHEPHGR